MIPDSLILDAFHRRFGGSPDVIARAPGRVNLIGEHTDYNGGYVLPAAITREIKMAARLRDDDDTCLYSHNYSEDFKFHHSDQSLPRPGKKDWHSYYVAVVHQFAQRGIPVPGLDVYVWGDVPLGAGLSSSAAFEVCVATLLNQLCDAGLTRKETALLAQAAEQSPYVGVQCGIMDQFVSALASESKALFLDCHTLDYKTVTFDSEQTKIVVINSMKPRELHSSDYNHRREECDEGLAVIRSADRQDYPTLRHVPLDALSRHAHALRPDVLKRVRHNLFENQRVLQFMKALEAGNWPQAGQLLYQSHASLRGDFEVSCQELDAIVDIAKTSEGVYGCRMTGAGFGGCAVALVKPENVEQFCRTLTSQYSQATGLTPEVYATVPAAGASVYSSATVSV